MVYSESEFTQSCPTLCDPVDCSPPGSSAHGSLQARILEWVAISFPRGSSRPRNQTRVSALQANTLTSEPPGKPSSRTLFIHFLNNCLHLGLLWWLICKESTCQCRRHRFNPRSGKIPQAAGQLSPCATTTEGHVARARALQ